MGRGVQTAAQARIGQCLLDHGGGRSFPVASGDMNGFEPGVGIAKACQQGPDVIKAEDHPELFEMFQIGFEVMIGCECHGNPFA